MFKHFAKHDVHQITLRFEWSFFFPLFLFLDKKETKIKTAIPHGKNYPEQEFLADTKPLLTLFWFELNQLFGRLVIWTLFWLIARGILR